MSQPHSLQLQSVLDIFGEQGWQCETVEGRQVIETAFEAHHTRVHLLAQVFPELNALAIVAESPLSFSEKHLPYALELLVRSNKQLTLGNFEYDFDREMVVFRHSNLFEKEKYDRDIIISMVHCAIAELDRFIPYAATVQQTAPDLLEDLSIERLLMREDMMPPIPEDSEEEEF